jgi:hypothetical protein
MKQSLKKIMSLALILCLVGSLLSNGTFATENTLQTLYLGGTVIVENSEVKVTSGTGWSFDAGTNTLTLSGVVIETSNNYSDGDVKSALYTEGDLTIILEGENSLSSGSHSMESGGMIIGGSLTIQGEGSLTTVGGSAQLSYGIIVDENITISESAQVTATGGVGSGGSYGINALELNVTDNATLVAASVASDGQNRVGVSAANVSITGGEIISKGYNYAINAVNPPDLSGYSNVYVGASENFDGSSLEAYNEAIISSYKYLKIKEAILTVDPASYTFPTLEDGYGTNDYSYLDDVEAKTFTITNIGDTQLTDISSITNMSDGNWYGLTKTFSKLDPNQSGEIILTPYEELEIGDYEVTIFIGSNEVSDLAILYVDLTVKEREQHIVIGNTDSYDFANDFSGSGYSWDATTKTLTLTSAYEKGKIEFLGCENEAMTIFLDGDVTIDEQTSHESCIYSTGALTMNLNNYTLTLITGGDNNSPLYLKDDIILQNGNLNAYIYGSETAAETESISAQVVTVEEATIIAKGDSLNYGGIYCESLILKKGAEIVAYGQEGLTLSSGDVLEFESDEVSLTAMGNSTAIYLDADLSYPSDSTLRSWTNTETTQPSPVGEGTLLTEKNATGTEDSWEYLWYLSKYVYVGTQAPETVVDPIVKYNLTVVNGTGSGEYEEGELVTLTADTPEAGKAFLEWVLPSDVSFTQEGTTSSTIIVTMPAKTVVISATYTDTTIDTSYTVTFNLNGGTRTGGGEITQSVENGESATAPTVKRNNYTFNGWNKDFSNVTSDLTVTASWSYSGSSDDESSDDESSDDESSDDESADDESADDESSDDESADIESDQTDSEAITISGSTAITVVTGEIGSNGMSLGVITQTQMDNAIEAAKNAANTTGQSPYVEIQMTDSSSVNGVEMILPEASMSALVTGEVEALIISTIAGKMQFDTQAIATLAKAASGDVTFTISQMDSANLSDAAMQVVGNHPVYELSIASGNGIISQFGGTVTVSLPYTLEEGEDMNAIIAYYINADGEPELIQNSHYDVETGSLVFKTTHYSMYAIGYNKVTFEDVSDVEWYAKAINYLGAREITNGTSETTFSPDETLTRGQFITLLLRAYGVETDESIEDNFSDAGNTYYTDYLKMAKNLGISEGVGDNNFSPEQAITRQDMFTLLYKTLTVIDQLPEGDTGKTLLDFTDNEGIETYAQEAMAYLVATGVVSGSNERLNPTQTTTRAEMAQVLYNLMNE